MQKLKGKFDQRELARMSNHVKYHGFSGIASGPFQEMEYTYGSGETWDKVKKILLNHCKSDRPSLERALDEKTSQSISLGDGYVTFKNFHILLPYFMGPGLMEDNSQNRAMTYMAHIYYSKEYNDRFPEDSEAAKNE